MSKQNKIEGLALRAVEAVIAMGVSRHTAWEAYEKVFCQVVALHKTRGKELFEPELLDEFIAIAAERFIFVSIK